jgi:transcriptional regulator with XRE-family HTH domain
MRNIGAEIKMLRERINMNGKDLAEKIGLSQSQMSRLEKGQRRIDTKILDKVADALGVKPSHFFGEDDEEERIFNLRSVDIEIGKIIRQRRHDRHFTVEDIASRVHKTKTYVTEIENGEAELLTNELIARICKVLKIDPWIFFEIQQKAVKDLKKQVVLLSRMLPDEAVEGDLQIDSSNIPSDAGRLIPVYSAAKDGYPSDFTNDGLPAAEVEGRICLATVRDDRAFALRCSGDSMVQPQAPSFAENDVLVFSSRANLDSKDFALVRVLGQKPLFRQIFFDPDGRIRTQPLNRQYPPVFLNRDEILQWFKLIAHVTNY